MTTPFVDHYRVLGVAPKASRDDITKCYRKMALRLHPDKNPDDPKAAGRFMAIQESYVILTDEKAREVCSHAHYGDYCVDAFAMRFANPSFVRITRPMMLSTTCECFKPKKRRQRVVLSSK
jgi:curved DNA-binding protein CbpA